MRNQLIIAFGKISERNQLIIAFINNKKNGLSCVCSLIIKGNTQ